MIEVEINGFNDWEGGEGARGEQWLEDERGEVGVRDGVLMTCGNNGCRR